MQRPRFLPDNFILALIAAIGLASILPIRGWAAMLYEHVTTVAIALLFFLHGAKLSREAVIAGASNWRLHLCVLAATFVLFPALAGLFMAQAAHAGGSLSAVVAILGEIVAPFAAGQIARRWIGGWVKAHPKVVKCVDQGSIVLPLMIFHQMQLIACAAIARRAAQSAPEGKAVHG